MAKKSGLQCRKIGDKNPTLDALPIRQMKLKHEIITLKKGLYIHDFNGLKASNSFPEG